MTAWVFWNPDPVCFTVPYLQHNVMWYGVCWAIGFFVALFLTKEVVTRFFAYQPEYVAADISNRQLVKKILKERFSIEGENLVALLNGLVLKERCSAPRFWRHRFLLRFARKRLDPHALQHLMNRLFLDEQLGKGIVGLCRRSQHLSERGWVFIAVGTVLGARLGHIFFYHPPRYFFEDPLVFFRYWEGGLASHGAVAGILISMVVWYRMCRQSYPMMHLIGWLDLATIPVLFGCAMIRIGNFFNQELLGTVSNLPWAIIFGNPEDGSLPQPRHPVQLYEATFYLILISIFYRIFFRRREVLPQGILAGLLLSLVFSFRFIVEFWKEQQGYYDPHMWLHTGQVLSIPCVCLGLAMIWYNRRESTRVIMDSLGS